MPDLETLKMLRSTAMAGILIAVGATASASPAMADADAKIDRLLDLLVQKKILSSRQAHELLRQTEDAPKLIGTSKTKIKLPDAPATKGEIRVTYVPQFVRKQIADQVRAQVMDETRNEGWAQPGALPEWTKRFHLYGDLRVRYERDSFSKGNYDNFVNFQGINQGSPFDIEGYSNGTVGAPPFLNSTQDRDRARVRARIGVQAQIDDWLTADVRISTGADQGPVTPNQTQGAPGDFAKYAAYIDRANFTGTPLPGLTLYAGRFNNPFSTTDLIFYNELGFDGIAGTYNHQVTQDTSAYISGGVFPILNTAFDFSTNNSAKYSSTNAYLFGVQGGGQWQIQPDILAKLGIGFFDFNGVQGAVSNPCSTQPGNSYNCSSDATRFPYEQFGNTVYAIRDIVPINGNALTSSDPQYFGLASRFAVLEAHPRVEISTYDPIDVALDGEFIKNLAYNRAAILAHGPSSGPIGPQNNLGSNNLYQGGDTGFILRGQLGSLQIHKRWDWNIMAAYKYVETDATLDSITDADFHLGGTNAKGYILTGSLGIAKDTFVSLRYFSASVISGPPDSNQVFQVDLQSSF